MKIDSLTRPLAGLAAISASGTGLFALFTWWRGQWRTATFGADYVPMAPITALLFLLLGLTLAVRLFRPESRVARSLVVLGALFALVVSGLEAGQSWLTYLLPWDNWLLPARASVGAIPVGLMAPLTAATFLLSAGALFVQGTRLTERTSVRWAASLAAFTGFMIGTLVAVGYAAGTPMQYGAQTVPMALLTGLAFMALNFGSLLSGPAHKLLQAWFADDATLPVTRENRRFTWRLVSAGTVIGGLIALAGFFHLRSEQTAARATAGEELDAIANLKAEQIHAWRNERLGEARFLLKARGVVEDIATFVARPDDPAARARLLGWLEPIKGGTRYESIMVFDPQGRLLLAIPTADGPAPRLSLDLLAEVLARQETLFTDLQREPVDTASRLDLLVPIRPLPPVGETVEPRAPGAPMAVVVLRINPQQFLFPLVQSWPVPSETAENLLVRREGDEVVFLNELRHRPGGELPLRRSLHDSALPAALGAKGISGKVEGVDYRGVNVLARIRQIPGSPWILVSKIDQAEIYAPLRNAALLNGTLVVSLLLTLTLAGAFIWRQRHAGFLRQALAVERERTALSERLALLTRHANDIIVLFDENRRIVEANERALTAYGRTLEEMRQLGAVDLRATAKQPQLEADYSAALLPEGTTFETSHRRKNGTEFPVEVSARMVVIDGRRHVLSIVRDITERQLAAENLRRSEEDLAITLQSIGDAVIATDAAGLVTRMNPTAERLTGWSLADARGRTLAEVFRIVNAETRVPAIDPVQLVLARGEMVGLANHTALLARDGREFLISDSAAPIRDHAGRIAGVVLVFSDVTEKYLVQKALAHTAELLERTSEMAKVGGWELDLLTNELIWSQETCRIHELELPGVSTIAQAIAFYAPEARPLIEAAVRNAIDHGTPFDLELSLITAKGRAIWVRTQGTAETKAGKVIKLLGTIQDITERKQAGEALRASEQRYRSILNASPDDITIADLEGRILLVSPAGMTMFGYESDHDFLGHPVTDFLVPEDRDKASAKIALMYRGAMPGVNEYHGLRRDGTVFDLEVNSDFIRDAAGQPVNIIFVARDITARKRVEATLRATLLEREALLKEVHHRVKNNLQVITSLLRLEAARSAQPDTKSVLGDMQGRIRSMAMLHESLYRSGTFAAVDLGAYLKQVAIQLFRALVAMPGSIQLQLDMATAPIELDQAMPCGLLIHELVSNALKHGFPNGRTGEVCVELHLVEGGPQIRLSVADTGVGLPADFELKRSDSLGLQLVGDLVRQLDGQLEIGSGPGTNFKITFTPRTTVVAPVIHAHHSKSL